MRGRFGFLRRKGPKQTGIAILCLVLVLASACPRKDVDRHGNIKLRGEKPVSLENKRKGDLLQKGIASWYGHPYHGRRTANGEVYNMWSLSAAHKTLPFGTVVLVKNRDNGKSVRVRINDRGPFIQGRVIDLSRRAARDLGMENQGTAEVAIYLHDKLEIRPGPVAPASSAKGFWTVQVGSFLDVERARSLRARMRDYADRVDIRHAGGMHRVHVGAFDSKKRASKLANKLLKDGYDCWITFVAKP